MTHNLSLLPMMGMDTETDETRMASFGDNPAVFLTDAVNVNISAEGRPSVRAGLRRVSDLQLLDIVHDRLHGDTFGRDAAHNLVRVDTTAGTADVLTYAGDMPLSLLSQATRTLFATAAGLVEFDGVQAYPFALSTPPAPMLAAMDNGALAAGSYRVALAWLRGGMESACSQTAAVTVAANGRIRATLPLCLDATADKVRVFVSDADGGRLRAVGDFELTQTEIELASVSALNGSEPRFAHMEPMPSGLYLCQWAGRLCVARANVLHFSEPMAWHIHDPRHGFIQMPQRITFLAPVDGGLWVGQRDHVAFISGQDVRDVQVRRVQARAPVPSSAVVVDGSIARETGGRPAAVWLAENGHVIGMPDGTLLEPRANRLGGIAGASGTTVTLNSKLLTLTR